MSDIVAERIMVNWALRCDALAVLDFEPVERIRSRICDMRLELQSSLTGFLPISEDKLKAEQPEWYTKIMGGGNQNNNVPPPPPSNN